MSLPKVENNPVLDTYTKPPECVDIIRHTS